VVSVRKRRLWRVIDISTSISFEIKAYDDDVHRMLTGAPSTPVLRNVEVLATRAGESIHVFGTVVIPGITERQVLKIAEFIAEIDHQPHSIILSVFINHTLRNGRKYKNRSGTVEPMVVRERIRDRN
jgi:pyruvate-formate lyase-activating enzyme